MRRPPPVASVVHGTFGSSSNDDLVCSFCQRARPDWNHRLIAGPDGVFICDECAELCVEILKEQRRG
jgi:ATP-dependent Clp protease ATP-binding subunit ClpX